MKELKIRYGALYRPYCYLFGHDLNQPLVAKVKKGYVHFRMTNVVYCKRCDLFIGTQTVKFIK